MGAWGTSSFENDDADDWLWEFSESLGVRPIKKALNAVNRLKDKDYLEITEAASAVAAAEIVAALTGNPHPQFSTLAQNLATWAAKQKATSAQQLTAPALTALARIKQNSELNDAWIDTSNSPDWLKEIAALEQRLA